jgi:hypothetical protein
MAPAAAKTKAASGQGSPKSPKAVQHLKEIASNPAVKSLTGENLKEVKKEINQVVKMAERKTKSPSSSPRQFCLTVPAKGPIKVETKPATKAKAKATKK